MNYKITTRIAVFLLAAVTSATVYAQATFAPDKVLVSNSRASVTYRDFMAELARIPQRDHLEFLLNRERLAQFLDNILTNKTLAVEARANNLQDLPEVKAEILNQTEKVLAKYRGQQIQREATKVDYTARAREIFLSDQDRFVTPEKHVVWHVLVSTKGRTKEQAKAKAEELRKRLIAGESRESIATAESDDASATGAIANKGNLSTVNLKETDDGFAKAVAAMKPKTYSDVFATNFGYHVAYLIERIPARRENFEVFRAQLLHEAETKYLLSVWEQHLRGIQNDPKLTVDTEAVEALRPKLPDLAVPADATGNKTPPGKG